MSGTDGIGKFRTLHPDPNQSGRTEIFRTESNRRPIPTFEIPEDGYGWGGFTLGVKGYKDPHPKHTDELNHKEHKARKGHSIPLLKGEMNDGVGHASSKKDQGQAVQGR